MINIGLLYRKRSLVRQVKKYLKNKDIPWSKVYTVSMVQLPESQAVKLIVGGANMKKLGEFDIVEVFPEGWEKKRYWLF